MQYILKFGSVKSKLLFLRDTLEYALINYTFALVQIMFDFIITLSIG